MNDSVSLVKDREVDPLLVRAYRDGQLQSWAVRDQFGWAIMARVGAVGESWVATVARYESVSGWSSPTLRFVALTGLVRYAATGRTDAP